MSVIGESKKNKRRTKTKARYSESSSWCDRERPELGSRRPESYPHCAAELHRVARKLEVSSKSLLPCLSPLPCPEANRLQPSPGPWRSTRKSSKDPLKPSWACALPSSAAPLLGEPERTTGHAQIHLPGWHHLKEAQTVLQATAVCARDHKHCIRTSQGCPFHPRWPRPWCGHHASPA